MMFALGFCAGALTASVVGVWWAWRAMAPHEPKRSRWTHG